MGGGGWQQKETEKRGRRERSRNRREGWLPAVKHCDRCWGEMRGEGGERCERRLIGAVILGEEDERR